ncbi:MAG TPA: RND transporter [Gammaproteobacteria bacterium]|nr:RND transporter [Gammaproteobacteria bacterium]
MQHRLINISLNHPKTIFLLVALFTLTLTAAFPLVKVDTDPENMLPSTQLDRVFHKETKERFTLHDMIVIGIINEQHSDGIYHPVTLANLKRLTDQIAHIEGVVEQDILALSTVDNISQEGPGTIRFQWMMADAPTDQAGAHEIADAVKRLPMFQDSLVSSDGQAAAIYVPIEHKDQSYRIVQEIQSLIDDLRSEAEYHITGLPVAEDTFGVEMFIQMAITAPAAAMVIFFLMWFFFRSFYLILAPMLLAMATVIITMGLLIGSGFTLHIMASMIPIFLMPIAVVDSVHILSEFSDLYKRDSDPKAVIREVMQDLFRPMLFTSLTSSIGFASLAITPIPPVQVFGLFVAFGIMLAFFLTIIFIPAYVVTLAPRRFEQIQNAQHRQTAGSLDRILEWLGRLSIARQKTIVFLSIVLVVISAIGISKISVNDNPVRWFKSHHDIRVADRVLNKHFAGTYNAFIVLSEEGTPPAQQQFEAKVSALLGQMGALAPILQERWQLLQNGAEKGDFHEQISAWAMAVDDELYTADEASLPFWEALLQLIESTQADLKRFQNPETLLYMQKLQDTLNAHPIVGKSNSVVDMVRTVYRELKGGEPEFYRLPPTQNGVAQTLLSYLSSHRPQDLWRMVTPDYQSANIWVQLKSGDNQDMIAVMEAVDEFTSAHPLPEGLQLDWAGLTYINVVWQEEMVTGMVNSLLSAFVVVFVMMVILFRSPLFALLAMLPLSLTIATIYGIIGWIGKDYDMPLATLSSLTLGLSIDFAIHFVQRARSLYSKQPDFALLMKNMFAEPARAISRNAIIIALGFLPLLAAPLVPYNTVGIFLAAIMAISCVVTLTLLPALMALFRPWLFKPNTKTGINEDIVKSHSA